MPVHATGIELVAPTQAAYINAETENPTPQTLTSLEQFASRVDDARSLT